MKVAVPLVLALLTDSESVSAEEDDGAAAGGSSARVVASVVGFPPALKDLAAADLCRRNDRGENWMVGRSMRVSKWLGCSDAVNGGLPGSKAHAVVDDSVRIEEEPFTMFPGRSRSCLQSECIVIRLLLHLW